MEAGHHQQKGILTGTPHHFLSQNKGVMGNHDLLSNINKRGENEQKSS